jgi:hypothetical protein
MNATLTAEASPERITVSFPESVVSASEKDEFVSFLKAEWEACQSRFSEVDAKAFADEVDSDWWTAQRTKILANIGEA